MGYGGRRRGGSQAFRAEWHRRNPPRGPGGRFCAGSRRQPEWRTSVSGSANLTQMVVMLPQIEVRMAGHDFHAASARANRATGGFRSR